MSRWKFLFGKKYIFCVFYQHLDLWAGFKILTIYFFSVSIIIWFSLVFNPGHRYRYRYRYRYRLHDLRLFSECLRMRAKRVVISLIPLPPAIKVYRPCNYLLPQMLPNATFANLYLQPATKIRKSVSWNNLLQPWCLDALVHELELESVLK